MFGSLLASSSVRVSQSLYDLVLIKILFGLRSCKLRKSPPTSIVLTLFKYTVFFFGCFRQALKIKRKNSSWISNNLQHSLPHKMSLLNDSQTQNTLMGCATRHRQPLRNLTPQVYAWPLDHSHWNGNDELLLIGEDAGKPCMMNDEPSDCFESQKQNWGGAYNALYLP